MQDAKKQSLEQIRAFLEGSQEMRFQGQERAGDAPAAPAGLPPQQGRAGKGLLRRYLAKMTGRSRAQITRLIGQYRVGGEVKAVPYRRHGFPTRAPRPRDAPLNFHRPCGQPQLVTNAPGKQKRLYRRYATPWEVLRRAACMQQAKRKLFVSFQPEKHSA